MTWPWLKKKRRARGAQHRFNFVNDDMLAVKKQNTLELHSISKRALKARDSRIKMNRKKTRNSKKQHKNLNSSNNYAGEATTTYSYNNKKCNNNADNKQQQHQQKQQSSSRLYCVLSQTQPNSAKLAYSGLILHALSLHLSVCLAQAKRAWINMRRHLGYPEAA